MDGIASCHSWVLIQQVTAQNGNSVSDGQDCVEQGARDVEGFPPAGLPSTQAAVTMHDFLQGFRIDSSIHYTCCDLLHQGQTRALVWML